MAYTKLEIAQRLQSLLYPETTEDAKLTVQEAMKLVSEARDEYVRNTIFANKGETNMVNGNWLSTFDDVDVKYDEVRCKWYTDLPAGVIALPEDMGVYQIWLCATPDDFLIPVSAGFMNMYRYSYAQMLEGKYAYFLIEDRLYYLNELDQNTKVGMNLIVQSADLGDMDYFPIDGSAIQPILQRAAELAVTQKNINQDVTNNGISE